MCCGRGQRRMRRSRAELMHLLQGSQLKPGKGSMTCMKSLPLCHMPHGCPCCPTGSAAKEAVRSPGGTSRPFHQRWRTFPSTICQMKCYSLGVPKPQPRCGLISVLLWSQKWNTQSRCPCSQAPQSRQPPQSLQRRRVRLRDVQLP